VNADDVVINVETDKLTVSVNAPESGTITSIMVEEGDTIGLGEPLFTMETGGEPPASATKPVAAETPAPTAVTPPAAPATPPAAPATPPPAPAKPAAQPAAASAGEHEDIPGVTRVKMSKIRQTVARRLKESQETAAFLTTFNEIDMSNLMGMRTKYKEDFQKRHDVKLGFMGAFSKAVAHAAKAEPAVNGGACVRAMLTPPCVARWCGGCVSRALFWVEIRASSSVRAANVAARIHLCRCGCKHNEG
jgi:2-oxoglutarate dehydrogenase E2 component (dihydrolipoamide succinyltransferase)